MASSKTGQWLAIVGVVTVASAAIAAVVTTRWETEFFNGIILVAVIGGVAMGLVRLLRPRDLTPNALVDPFARDVFTSDMVNISHVRVAGIGGAGLVLAAWVVAAQFPLTTVATVAGVVGGALGAAVVLLAKRIRRASRPS